VIIDNGDVTIPATNKLYFDGGGDTYIKEHSADRLIITVGGNNLLDLYEGGGGASDYLATPAATRFYLDGGGNTYFAESSADNIRFHAGGEDILDITPRKISGSLASTGSFGRLEVAGAFSVNEFESITTTGNISSSAYGYFGDRVYVNNDLALSHDGSTQLSVGFDSDLTTIRYGKDTDVVHNFLGAKISGSVASTGSFGKIIGADGIQTPSLGLGVITATNDILSIQPSSDGTNIMSAQDHDGNALFRVRDSSAATLMNLYDGGTETIKLDADLNGGTIEVGQAGGGIVSGSVASTGSFGSGHFMGTGGVGIGTTSPDAILQIMNNNGSSYRFGYGGTSDVYLDADNVYFRTDNGGANTATLTTTGLGIGTTSPSQPLTVAGNISASGDFYVGDDLYISDGGKIGTTAGIDSNDDHISFSDTNREITFTVDNDATMTIESGKVGIGTDDPDQTLHVHKASAGSIASDSNTVLTVENSDHSLIQILSPEAKDGAVMFGNPTDGALDGRVVYDNADRALQFWTANTQRVNITSDGNLEPRADDTYNLGAASLRWADVFAVQTTVGGIFEANLKTDEIGDNPTGTIVVWEEDKLVPCDKSEDELVMGVIKQGKDEPIVLGAEPVLVTGKVDVGDYIVTSDKVGHGKSIKRGYLLKKDLFGKVIAQALEKSDDSDSCLIKCMIRKM